MEKYKNVQGNSAVRAYQIGADFISVRFDDLKVYTYTYRSAGSHSIETMKKLALQGFGLNSFINKFVRKKYASKSLCVNALDL